jgi:hypothetical protein
MSALAKDSVIPFSHEELHLTGHGHAIQLIKVNDGSGKNPHL